MSYGVNQKLTIHALTWRYWISHYRSTPKDSNYSQHYVGGTLVIAQLYPAIVIIIVEAHKKIEVTNKFEWKKKRTRWQENGIRAKTVFVSNNMGPWSIIDFEPLQFDGVYENILYFNQIHTTDATRKCNGIPKMGLSHSFRVHMKLMYARLHCTYTYVYVYSKIYCLICRI